MSSAPTCRIEAGKLRALVAQIYARAGLSETAAQRVAEALVEADLQGLGSHGVMQSEAYIDRIEAGSISAHETAELVSDSGAVAVLDARDMMGHLAAEQGMALAVERARRFGIGAVAVRRACHYGAAGRYVEMATRKACIGIAMANTRPVMPAPGGAEPMVGTNPLAIGIPTSGEPPIIFDMATSTGSVGKIRVAQAQNRPLPADWAVDQDGLPTTDPVEALKGMLLPAAGPKGFGLSLVIDLLSGLLSGGGWGDAVLGNREHIERPQNAAHFFIAIDPAHFRAIDGFLDEARAAADRVRQSRRAPGVDRIHVPGERKWETRRKNGDTVSLARAHRDLLVRMARARGIEVDPAITAA